jgi:hypothetical protein
MILKRTLFLTVSLFALCGNDGKPDDRASVAHLHSSSTNTKAENALAFINSYVDNCNSRKQAVDIVTWANSSQLATRSFKTALKQMIDEAYKTEPEVGLDFDPILDAQDWPEEGFEIESIDDITNYLILRGKNWQEFKVTIKMIKENENWLVDGCGIVNIPKEKRAQR